MNATKLAAKHNRTLRLRRRFTLVTIEQRWRTVYITVIKLTRAGVFASTVSEKTVRFVAKCVAHRNADRIEAKYLGKGFRALA